MIGGKPFNGASRGSEVRNAILLPRRFRNAITPVSFWQKAIASGVGCSQSVRRRARWGEELAALQWFEGAAQLGGGFGFRGSSSGHGVSQDGVWWGGR
ncbi:hypothetical protein AP9108_26810 [Arthrospira sp. PCC 9108]|nr:hypothetical protein AP9108_26810 [Arthrospira sp. PCC 9108]